MTLKSNPEAIVKLDPQHDLRAAVADVEVEISRLADTGGLAASWRELVKVLKLVPPPALRTCPSCGGLGMLAATRCGYCWITLAPAGS
jgi:hypothetical protein